LLGLLRASERRHFATFAAIVNVCAIGGAWVFSGAWTLAVSVPAALVLVVSLWIARGAGPSDVAPNRDSALAAGLTVAWLAHFFEVQTGIATISSALVAAVALGATAGAADAPLAPVADRSREWIAASIAAAIAGAAVCWAIV